MINGTVISKFDYLPALYVTLRSIKKGFKQTFLLWYRWYTVLKFND